MSRAHVRAPGAAVRAVAALVALVAGLVVEGRGEALPSEADLRKLVEQRQEIVRVTLQLEPTERTAFEEAFGDYERDRAALAAERSVFVDDFSRATLAMSADRAKELTDRLLRLRRERLELDERYRSRFDAALSPQKTLLLFQLNFILDAVVNYDLAAMIPLAR